jgi:uncharacterized membrane protein
MPPSDGEGLPDIKRHLKEMGIRLSVVEGRVMVISERLGPESVESQPAVSRSEEAPKGELQPEIMGESFPVEVLAVEASATAVPCEARPVTPEALRATHLKESAGVEETHIVKEDVAVVAQVPSAEERVSVGPLVAESTPREPIKPAPERVESTQAEWLTPEVQTSPAGVGPLTVAETHVGVASAELAAEAPSVTQWVPAKPPVAESVTAEPVRARSGPETSTVKAAPARPPQEPPKPRQPSQLATRMREWEQALPGNWLSRIGMLALLIGLGFLTQWAYVNHKLERLPLLLVGLACGGALLFVGHHWRKEYGAWAQAITGGGIGVLYLSVFASYALYVNDPAGPVIKFPTTFLLMSVVTVLAVGIALRRNSMSIAILGIVGAFLVPITLGAINQSGNGDGGSGSNNTPVLIAYVLTLDVAVVWLASLRNWRWFTLLGFVGSMAVFSLWYCTSEKDGLLAPAQGMVTGIFLCFAAATTLFHGLQRHRPQLTDLGLMTVNAAVYFGLSHYLMWDGCRNWLGALGFGLAAFYAVLGYLFLRRSKENSLLSAFAFGIAITFVTVAIPVQLEKSYMTAAWAAEGVVLIWLAVRYGTPRWQLWGLGAFVLVLVRLFFDQFIRRAGFHPVLNDMFWAFAPGAVAFFVAAWFLRKKEKTLQPWFFPMMMLLANFLTVWLFSFEIIDFAGSRMLAAHSDGAVGYGFRSVENARNLSLVALWSVYGLALSYAGARKGWVWLRFGGYALVAMAVGTTLVELNYLHAMIRNDVSNPIANYSFGALTVCVSMLGLVAYLVRKCDEKMTEVERAAFPVVVSMANILAVYALTAEVFTFLDKPLNARNLVVVALWAAYGLGIMIVGLWRGWAWLRVQGWLLGLMAIGMTVTTLNYGHFLMKERPVNAFGNYSFGAFAICIAAVGAMAWVITGNRKRLHAAETGLFPVLVLLANFLAVWVFSSEVVTFIHDDAENVRNLVLVALWCTYGLGLLMVGIRKNWDWLRVAGYVLAVVAAGATLTLLNHSHAKIDSVHHSIPILNYSLGGFAICVAALYLYAYAVARNREQLHEFEKIVCIVALGAANVLTLWGLSEEIVAFLAGNLQNLMLVILWLGYGSWLMAIGVARKALLLRVGACALMIMAVGATAILLNHWVADIAPEEGSRPILNYSFGAFTVCIAASYLFAYLTAGRGEKPDRFDQVVCGVALALANVLTIWALSAEVITFLSGNLQNLVLVILWSGHGLLLMLAGAWRGVPMARFGGYALIAIAVGVTSSMLNHTQPGLQRSDYHVVINPSFGGFFVCVIALYVTSYLVSRNSSKLLDAERVVLSVLIVAANALSLIALSSEVLTYASAGYGQSMGLTVLWAAYGLAMMVVGIMGKWAWVRLGGLVLVSIAILKLFIIDTFTLQAGYRVAAYLTLGVLLLAGGFVYHRYAEVIKALILDRPEKGVGSARK